MCAADIQRLVIRAEDDVANRDRRERKGLGEASEARADSTAADLQSACMHPGRRAEQERYQPERETER